MVAVVASVLAGGTVALLVAVASSDSLAGSISAGTVIAILAMLALMERQRRALLRYEAESSELAESEPG
jgi:hypothetical protein